MFIFTWVEIYEFLRKTLIYVIFFADYPDYSGTYYNNFPLKDEDGNPKNGPKYEEGEEPNAVTSIDY